MKGAEVFSLFSEILQGDEMIVSSNGNVSRQAFHLLNKPHIYLRGSMGLPLSVGLGLSLAQPEKKVIVITGDGNFLMGLGSLTTIAHFSPENLRIIILDNEIYATTGGQLTVSSTINYKLLIEGSGVENVFSLTSINNEKEVKKSLIKLLKQGGLQLLHIKVERDDIKLANIDWHPTEITKKFHFGHKIHFKSS